MSNTNKQTASTLIEVLVAVSIIALVMTAISAMMAMSIKLAESNEKKQLALQKAEEALEFFRKERSISSWSGFSTPLTDGAVYCINVLPESVASISAQLGACAEGNFMEAAKYSFQRQAAISFNDINNVKITVDMNWQDGEKAKDLSLDQNFENY